IAQREEVIVPQSPGVRLAMWISQPMSFSRISVPAHRNSASSGWASIESAILDGSVFTRVNCRLIESGKQRLFRYDDKRDLWAYSHSHSLETAACGFTNQTTF